MAVQRSHRCSGAQIVPDPLDFRDVQSDLVLLDVRYSHSAFGAIYTSEFLPARARGSVKPVMEVMASIPSVVLGFVAALVLAPIVENWISSVLLVFWRLAAYTHNLRLSLAVAAAVCGRAVGGNAQVRFDVRCCGVGLYLCYLEGPQIEKTFFGGNFPTWLNGEGSAVPFLFLITVPLAAVAVSWSASRLVGSRMNTYIRSLEMPYSALLDLCRWLGMRGVTALLSYLIATGLTYLGVDRGIISWALTSSGTPSW